MFLLYGILHRDSVDPDQTPRRRMLRRLYCLHMSPKISELIRVEEENIESKAAIYTITVVSCGKYKILDRKRLKHLSEC